MTELSSHIRWMAIDATISDYIRMGCETGECNGDREMCSCIRCTLIRLLGTEDKTDQILNNIKGKEAKNE